MKKSDIETLRSNGIPIFTADDLVRVCAHSLEQPLCVEIGELHYCLNERCKYQCECDPVFLTLAEFCSRNGLINEIDALRIDY